MGLSWIEILGFTFYRCIAVPLLQGISNKHQGNKVSSHLLDHSSPQTPMSIPSYKPLETEQMQIHLSTIDSDLDTHDSFLLQEHGKDDDDEEEEFSEFILNRDRSSLSTYLRGLKVERERNELDSMVRKTVSMRADKENSRLEKAVRRALSMRASPSVTEKYQRIDYQYDLVGDGEDGLLMQRKESTKKGNKIFEACRRFFGF